MSLHNLETTVTPDELTAIQNCINQSLMEMQAKRHEAIASRTELSSSEHYRYQCAVTASKWAAAQSELLYQAWAALPEGSHLKSAYAEDIWAHSDRDLMGMS